MTAVRLRSTRRHMTDAFTRCKRIGAAQRVGVDRDCNAGACAGHRASQLLERTDRVNFLIAGYAYTRRHRLRSSAAAHNEELKTSSAILAYARVIDVWGMSGEFDEIVPYTSLSGSADFAGEQ